MKPPLRAVSHKGSDKIPEISIWGLTELSRLHDILFKIPPLGRGTRSPIAKGPASQGYRVTDWLCVEPRRIPTPTEYHTASKILPILQ
jgi:hypothetical protein